MVSETVDKTALALCLEGVETDSKKLGSAIKAALARHGICPWDSIDADVFTYCGSTLVLARPAPPLLRHVSVGGIRLKRH